MKKLMKKLMEKLKTVLEEQKVFIQAQTKKALTYDAATNTDEKTCPKSCLTKLQAHLEATNSRLVSEQCVQQVLHLNRRTPPLQPAAFTGATIIL
jgi:transcription initiation factor IIE alpha subunit